MVNFGRSWGCKMCKKRRIKCDELEPACKRCTRSGYVCPGYDSEKPIKIRFKDETALVTHRVGAGGGPSRGSGSLPVPAVAPLQQGVRENFETKAFNFFILNFATAGRDDVSSRGLWETVAPTISRCSATSPVADAATAVGGILFNIWRLHRDGPNARNPAFNRAIKGLRERLGSGDPIDGPEVLMTILLLQFHENIAAVFGLRPASRMHYNGALALIRSLPIESFSTVASRKLLLNVLNIEVSLSIRECQPVDKDLIPWFNSLPYTLPTNPAMNLCWIGISVANIQHRFEQISREHPYCSEKPCLHENDISKLHNEILDFHKKSSHWLKEVPEHWLPTKWKPSVSPNAPIPMYQDTCEIYPSVQIASVFNTYRGYQLIINKILSIMHTHHWLAPDVGPQDPQETIQSVVDHMCYSIPFYLGNRSNVQTIADLTNPKPKDFYPAYHNMQDPSIPKEHVLNEQSHRKHVIAYGAWHSMYPLSMLISLFNNHSGYDCDCLTRSIRPGQLMWIGTQLYRMMKIYALDNGIGASPENPKECAQAVRRALRSVYQECFNQSVGFPDDEGSLNIPIRGLGSYLKLPESVWYLNARPRGVERALC